MKNGKALGGGEGEGGEGGGREGGRGGGEGGGGGGGGGFKHFVASQDSRCSVQLCQPVLKHFCGWAPAPGPYVHLTSFT